VHHDFGLRVQSRSRLDFPLPAVTRYGVSEGTWSALGGTAGAGYDLVNGNVLWRQLGDDQARRVTFRNDVSRI
jgi:hypothetical protein